MGDFFLIMYMSTTMKFLETLTTFEVSAIPRSTAPLFLMGFLLWSVPMSLYACALGLLPDASSTAVRALWSAEIATHGLIGILVLVDAFVTEGLFWPLQALIIGGATYITFTLPSLLGYHLVQRDDTLVWLASFALLSACLANAVMVSILFELFHRGIRKTLSPQTRSASSIRAGRV